MALDLADFKKTLTYVNSASVGKLRADLDALRELDKHQEKLTRRWGVGCFLAVLATIGGGIAAANTDGDPAALAGLGAGVVGMIVTGWCMSSASALDTEDRRYELLARLLELLSPDLPADAKVRVRLDLKPSNHKSKHSHKGQVRVWQVDYYVDPWLQVETKLADGTALKLLMTERRQDRVKHYRSRSGKSKSKRKQKSSHVVLVGLKPKTKRYDHLSQLAPQAKGAIKLPPFGLLKDLSVEEGAVTLKVATKENWGASAPGEPDEQASGTQLVAMMLLSLYQILNLSRELTRKGA